MESVEIKVKVDGSTGDKAEFTTKSLVIMSHEERGGAEGISLIMDGEFSIARLHNMVETLVGQTAEIMKNEGVPPHEIIQGLSQLMLDSIESKLDKTDFTMGLLMSAVQMRGKLQNKMEEAETTE